MSTGKNQFKMRKCKQFVTFCCMFFLLGCNKKTACALGPGNGRNSCVDRCKHACSFRTFSFVLVYFCLLFQPTLVHDCYCLKPTLALKCSECQSRLQSTYQPEWAVMRSYFLNVAPLLQTLKGRQLQIEKWSVLVPQSLKQCGRFQWAVHRNLSECAVGFLKTCPLHSLLCKTSMVTNPSPCLGFICFLRVVERSPSTKCSPDPGLFFQMSNSLVCLKLHYQYCSYSALLRHLLGKW